MLNPRGILIGIPALLLLLGLAAPAPAQVPPGAFTPFLNASDLRAIDHDPVTGAFWIASNGGALRYSNGLDDSGWTAFPRRRVGGPVSNNLTAVAIDGDGLVWVGSGDRGVSTYDPATGRWERFEELPDPRVTVIRSFGDAVFIGTQAGLALRFEPQRTEICNDIDVGCIVPSFDVRDYALIGNSLWVATAAGLGRFNGTTWDSLHTLPDGSVGQESLSLAVFGDELWEVSVGSVRRLTGGVWTDTGIEADALVTTDGRLLAIDGDTVYDWSGSSWNDLQLVIPAGTAIRDLEIVGDSAFLATDDGLRSVPLGSLTEAPRLLPPGPQIPDFHRGIAIDASGTVWAGNQEGLLGYDGSTWSVFPKGEDGLDQEWIFSLVAAEDEIAIGHCCCNSPPRCRLDLRSGGGFAPTDANDIWALAVDPRGRIWAGTDNSGALVLERNGAGGWDVVLTIDNASTGGALRSNSIRAIAVTEEGTYFGHTQSLGVDFWPHRGTIDLGFSPSGWQAFTVSSGLLDGSVSSIRAAGPNVYVGTSTGLHRLGFGAVLEAWPTNFFQVPGDLPRIVQTIAVDRLGGVWGGTNNGLLYREPGATGFKLFDTTVSDLTHDNVLASDVSPVDGSLWFGTAEGIVQVDPLAVLGRDPEPDAFALYPNPFRVDQGHVRVTLGLTTAGSLPGSAAEDIREAEVIDITGRLVGVFELRATEWQWDLQNVNGDRVTPGIYIVRATTASGAQVELKLGVVR